MRPEATSLKKKATTRRKNHQHWSRHKHEILAKRSIQTLKFPQVQILNENECKVNDIKTNDTLNFLSTNETANDSNTEYSDENDLNDDFINTYFDDIDEYGISFDTFHQDQIEEEIDEEEIDGEEIDEEEIEETFIEQQTEFADQFMSVESSTTPVRYFDYTVDHKKKHKCTNSLINDILKMLKALKVPNIPASWYRLTEIIKRTEETSKSKSKQRIIDSTSYFCPECEQESIDPKKCTNTNCSYYSNCLIPPHTFMVMNIQQQIEEVLRSTHRNDLDLSAQTLPESTTSLIDIYHGGVYRNTVHSLRNENNNRFISLTCNIDGAAVYTSSEQTMWAFMACLNELNRSIRFNIEKMIGNNFVINK
ncbi:unnamed protein product [Rotaria sp. Silwood2]|nr:unnamed protein product [Rotaria sp. Silwood2]CAF3046985.1 unnamed protein product [Rotaria sp. Silwood2]CAF3456147.1 unnamed protein product [Rotaria sp. Silwood2]CAF4246096.1 unnamed protein product [Rotaria sp. Silwood2]CAF4258707.1 unnamed protein product [Rotaria sp. Silwood2]